MQADNYLLISRQGTRACLLILALLCSSCAARQPETPLTRAPVHYAQVVLLDGSRHILSEFLQRDTVVFFWSSWCSKSRKEIAKLEELLRWARSAGIELHALAVALDKNQDLEKVKQHIAAAGLSSMQHCFSGNENYDEAYLTFGGDELPQLYLVDAQSRQPLLFYSVKDLEAWLRENGQRK